VEIFRAVICVNLQQNALVHALRIHQPRLQLCRQRSLVKAKILHFAKMWIASICVRLMPTALVNAVQAKRIVLVWLVGVRQWIDVVCAMDQMRV